MYQPTSWEEPSPGYFMATYFDGRGVGVGVSDRASLRSMFERIGYPHTRPGHRSTYKVPSKIEPTLPLRIEPRIHPLLQQVQRQCTGTEQFVVKGTDVESVAQCGLGVVA